MQQATHTYIYKRQHRTARNEISFICPSTLAAIEGCSNFLRTTAWTHATRLSPWKFHGISYNTLLLFSSFTFFVVVFRLALIFGGASCPLTSSTLRREQMKNAMWKRNKIACGNFAKKLQLTNCGDSCKCAGTYSNNTNKQQLPPKESRKKKIVKGALAHKQDNRNENEWLCCGASCRSCNASNGAAVVKARAADCKGDNILLMRCTSKLPQHSAGRRRATKRQKRDGGARKIDCTKLFVVVYTREGQCHEFEIKSSSRPLWA